MRRDGPTKVSKRVTVTDCPMVLSLEREAAENAWLKCVEKTPVAFSVLLSGPLPLPRARLCPEGISSELIYSVVACGIPVTWKSDLQKISNLDAQPHV